MKKIISIIFLSCILITFSYSQEQQEGRINSINNAFQIAGIANLLNDVLEDYEIWDYNNDGKITIMDALNITHEVIELMINTKDRFPNRIKISVGFYSGRVTPIYTITDIEQIKHIYYLLTQCNETMQPCSLHSIPLGLPQSEDASLNNSTPVYIHVSNGCITRILQTNTNPERFETKYFNDNDRKIENFFYSIVKNL